MLDFDLAELYGSETKRLKEAVRRNLKRFPSDFMFELTKEEFESLRSQIASSNKRGGTRYMPFAFTEQGVAMLSSVLNSESAIEINISIMRAFVTVRQYLSSLNSTTKEIEELKQRMKMLEEGNEDTIAAVNDLSEDTRKELDDIYLALSQLAGCSARSSPGRNRSGPCRWPPDGGPGRSRCGRRCPTAHPSQ